MSMQSSDDPTLLLGSDVSTDYVFSISNSVFSEQGVISLAPSTPPPSPRMVFFDWNDLVEPRLPSSAPFQIRVEVNSTNIYRCIVDEGASASILSSSVWKVLGSPKLVSTSHELLAFDIRPSEYLGVVPQFPISLGGKIVRVNVIVVQGPLYFNMLLGHDYVYAMKVVVSTLFRVMHFPHNGSIVTIDQLASDNHHPNSALFQATPLHVPSVRVDSTPPWVNYVASYPRCSIASEKEPMKSCFPSRDLVSTIDPLVYPMGAWEPLFPPLGPSDLEYPSEYVLIVCRSSSPRARDSSLIDSVSLGQNLYHHTEYGQFTSLFGTVDPHLRDFSIFELPSNEAILEAMTTVSIPWEDLHRGLCFLPFWETFQVDYRRDSWSKPNNRLYLNQFHT
jgi:hypothetical protein